MNLNSSQILSRMTFLVFVILIFLFPIQLFFQHGSDVFKHLPVDNYHDETSYLSYISHALRSPHFVGNPSLIEHIKAPQPRVAVIEFFLGRLGTLFDLSIHNIYWINILFFPLMWFLLLYRLFRGFKSSREVSALSAFVILTFLINFYLFRSIHPPISATFFYLHLLVLAKFFQKMKKKYWFFLGGTTLLQFYNYPYYWIFSLTVMILLSVIFLLKGQKKIIFALGGLGITILPGLIPFAANAIEVATHPYLDDLFFRMGYQNNEPVFSKSNWLFLILALLMRASPPTKWFFISAAIAGIICTNQQLITGHHPSSSRYIWYIIKPLLTYLVIDFVYKNVIKNQKYQTALYALSLLALSGYFFASTSQFMNNGNIQKSIQLMNQTETLMKWVQKNISPNQVIACPIKLAPLFEIYGHQYVYATLNSGTQLVSQKEYSQRLHDIDFLESLTPDGYRQLLTESLPHRTNTHYLSHFKRKYGDYAQVDPKYANQLTEWYEKTYRKNKNNWQPSYHVDYVIIEAEKINRQALMTNFFFIAQVDRYEIHKKK